MHDHPMHHHAGHDDSASCGCGHHHAAPTDPHAARKEGQVSLTGRLVCRDLAEMLTVLDHADDHVAASRAEPGCLQFDLRQTDDPLVFAFAERFADAAAYRAHQDRTRASLWWSATRDIAREGYDRRGLDA